MSLTEFAMVEELGFLIKDNLPCKHLVLSVEEKLVNFLQDDTSLDGVLELQPMNSYNRLLIHRLADIFGFSHQSIGEGDNRHLVLKRCEETAMPSILVADLLWEHDECQFPTTSQLLSRREEASPGTKPESLIPRISLEEREAAYLAARDRIFSADEGETKGLVKQKPRNNPVVARRMIAHALGQRIGHSDQAACLRNTIGYGEPTDEMNIQEKDEAVTNSSLESCRKTNISSTEIVNSYGLRGFTEDKGSILSAERKVMQKPAGEASTKVTISRARRHDMKEEHIGAAKRMFAHALRIHSTKDTILSKCSETKQSSK